MIMVDLCFASLSFQVQGTGNHQYDDNYYQYSDNIDNDDDYRKYDDNYHQYSDNDDYSNANNTNCQETRR